MLQRTFGFFSQYLFPKKAGAVLYLYIYIRKKLPPALAKSSDLQHLLDFSKNIIHSQSPYFQRRKLAPSSCICILCIYSFHHCTSRNQLLQSALPTASTQM